MTEQGGQAWAVAEELDYNATYQKLKERRAVKGLHTTQRGLIDFFIEDVHVEISSYGRLNIYYKDRKGMYRTLRYLKELCLNSKGEPCRIKLLSGEVLFKEIKEWMAENVQFPKKEDFDKGLIYSDKATEESVRDLLNSKRYCLLQGSPASRKTTFALSFGLDLLREGYFVYYFKIRQEHNISWSNLFGEVYDHEKCLFIIDDCHKSVKEVYEFIFRVKRETKRARFLFISRRISMLDPDYDYFKDLEIEGVSIELKPTEEIFRGIIELFCISRGIRNYAEKIGEIDKILKTCGNNVLFLNYLLEAWNDILKVKEEEILSNITRERFYEKIFQKYNLFENTDLLKLCAIYQFEIPVSRDFVIAQIPENKIIEWLKEGLIFDELAYYTLPHSSFARVILRAGETHKLLIPEGNYLGKSLEDYTLDIIEKYLRFEETNLPQLMYRIHRDEEIKIVEKLININNNVALSAIIKFFNSEASLNSKINFLAFLKSREQIKNEVIKTIDLNKITEQIKYAELKQFQQLTTLLNSIKSRQEELIKKLDLATLSKLSEEISNAEPNRFQDIANLFDTFGSSKSNLLALLDYHKITEKTNQVTNPDDLRGLTLFMARLDEENRNELTKEIDWTSLCIKCPINAGRLRALGVLLENLWKQAEMLSDTSGEEKIAQYLRNRESEVIEAIEEACKEILKYLETHRLVQRNEKRARRASTMYAGLGKFLFNYAQIDYDSAFNIISGTMNKLIECFEVAPSAYYYIGQLVNAFHLINPDLSSSFLTNNKIRGRIQWSINNHNWSANLEGLKHLIEAFYRSAPVIWKKMVNYKWITVDLGPLDLDSIYKKVDEEKTEEHYVSSEILFE